MLNVLNDDLDDLEVDVAGVPMPAWLMSAPSAVCYTRVENYGTVTFEQLFNSMSWTCTWPRYASMISRPDPQQECGFRLDEYDEEEMIAHATTHHEK